MAVRAEDQVQRDVRAAQRASRSRTSKPNHPGENVWTLDDNVITSTSFASWDDRRAKEIALADWDLVIVDEAHHARRTLGNLAGTRFYRLVQSSPTRARELARDALSDGDADAAASVRAVLADRATRSDALPELRGLRRASPELAGLNQTVDARSALAGLSTAPARSESQTRSRHGFDGPSKRVHAELERPGRAREAITRGAPRASIG